MDTAAKRVQLVGLMRIEGGPEVEVEFEGVMHPTERGALAVHRRSTPTAAEQAESMVPPSATPASPSLCEHCGEQMGRLALIRWMGKERAGKTLICSRCVGEYSAEGKIHRISYAPFGRRPKRRERRKSGAPSKRV